MKIRTFFLGSVAAFVTVSGARAADAVVVVEPEPMEYVRVCDAYGAGFFYIPGTETCLKFSGYVRGTYTGKNTTTKTVRYTVPLPVADPETGTPPAPDTQSLPIKDAPVGLPAGTSISGGRSVKDSNGKVGYRARLNVDARNETEWGTLRSQIRFQGSGGTDVKEDVFGDGDALGHGGDNGNVEIARALVSLAGFRVGYSSDYWTTVGDFGYFTAINDGIYSDATATFADYTFSLDGFSLTVGAQTASGTREHNGEDYVNATGTGKKPDFYVGATYGGSWGNVFGTYYHDSSVKKGAYKVGAELSMDDYLSGTAIKGWYMDDGGKTDYVGGHAWGVTAKVALSDSWSLYGGYSRYKLEGDDLIARTARSVGEMGVGASVVDRATDWTLGARWEVASGLAAYFEYNNREASVGEVISVGPSAQFAADVYDKEAKSYVVRLIRTF